MAKAAVLMLVAALAAAPLCAQSNETPTEFPSGFVGIPWGTSASDLIQEMERRDGVEFAGLIDGGGIRFTGGEFGGWPVVMWSLHSDSGGLYAAIVGHTITSPITAVERYEGLVEGLTDRYGAPASTEFGGDDGRTTWNWPAPHMIQVTMSKLSASDTYLISVYYFYRASASTVTPAPPPPADSAPHPDL